MSDILLDSVGGSLLNDLLSDLNAAVDASIKNNTAASNSNNHHLDDDDGGDDDLFALLEQELTSSYNTPLPSSGIGGGHESHPPGGMMMGMGMGSAAAFVVNQQQQQRQQQAHNHNLPSIAIGARGGGGGNNDDAWSTALSQFGGFGGGLGGSMSLLAADFLAADATAKTTTRDDDDDSDDDDAPMDTFGGGGPSSSSGILPDKLFEEEEYKLEQEVTLTDNNEGTMMAGQSSGGLAALLGAATLRGEKTAKRAEAIVKESSAPLDKTAEVKKPNDEVARQPPARQQPRGMPVMGVPPPGPMVMHPPPGAMLPPGMMPGMMMPPPPGAMPGMMHMMMPPTPHGAMMPQGMMMPPGAMHPGMMMPHPGPGPHPMMPPPGAMMPPQYQGGQPHQQPSMGILPLSPPSEGRTRKGGLSSDDFPALGVEPPVQKKRGDSTVDSEEKTEEDEVSAPRPALPPTTNFVPKHRFYFNNTNPSADPIAANRVASKLMPSRDVTFIVHMMLRPLQSLDAYNDDYYHFSMMTRGIGPMNPVVKDVKAKAHENEAKFHEAMRARAKTFMEEKKSLGQLVRTNVKRPKALLTTPVMNKENDANEEKEEGKDGEQQPKKVDANALATQRSRISTWKARMSIDRGYSAFLALIELRRLIQANAGQPRLIGELMVDVKSNVDKLHSSLGVSLKVEQGSNKKMIDVDGVRLASALSLPKGRVLAARVIETGILPHNSACHLLPAALGCILSWPVVTVTASSTAQPGAASANEGEDRLLHALTGLVRTHQPSVDPAILLRCLEELSSTGDASAITGSYMRMELVHSILSVGKSACAGGDNNNSWSEKEKAFMEILAGSKGK